MTSFRETSLKSSLKLLVQGLEAGFGCSHSQGLAHLAHSMLLLSHTGWVVWYPAAVLPRECLGSSCTAHAPDIYTKPCPTFLLLPGAVWSSDAVGSAAQPVLRDGYHIQWRMASPLRLRWVPVDEEKRSCRSSEQVVNTVLQRPGVGGCRRHARSPGSSGSTALESRTVPCSATWAQSPQLLCAGEGLHP